MTILFLYFLFKCHLGTPWSAEWSTYEFAWDRFGRSGLSSKEKSLTVSCQYPICFLFPPFWIRDSPFSSYCVLCHCPRSPDLLQPEEPFTLSERRSSSDSNKASSGEVSPYDNNSPVLSDRREAGSPGNDQLFRIPEQYNLTGQVAGWNREGGAETLSAKGRKWLSIELSEMSLQFYKNITSFIQKQYQRSMLTSGGRGTLLSNQHLRTKHTQVHNSFMAICLLWLMSQSGMCSDPRCCVLTLAQKI